MNTRIGEGAASTVSYPRPLEGPSVEDVPNPLSERSQARSSSEKQHPSPMAEGPGTGMTQYRALRQVAENTDGIRETIKLIRGQPSVKELEQQLLKTHHLINATQPFLEQPGLPARERKHLRKQLRVLKRQAKRLVRATDRWRAIPTSSNAEHSSMEVKRGKLLDRQVELFKAFETELPAPQIYKALAEVLPEYSVMAAESVLSHTLLHQGAEAARRLIFHAPPELQNLLRQGAIRSAASPGGPSEQQALLLAMIAPRISTSTLGQTLDFLSSDQVQQLKYVLEQGLGMEKDTQDAVLDRLEKHLGASVKSLDEESPARKAFLPAPGGLAEHRTIFASYLLGSRVILQAVEQGGYADFVDSTLGGHLRPHDAEDAVLRMTAAYHSVLTDMESGRLTPEDFGTTSWDLVSSKNVQKLAMMRLKDDNFDVKAAAQQLKHDPSWRQSGLTASFEESERLFSRSVVSYMAPNRAAHILNADPVWKALSAAAATSDPKLVILRVVHSMHMGEGAMSQLSGQALQAVIEAAGLSVFSGYEVVTASEAEMEQQVEQGVIDGYQRTPSGRFARYTLKSPARLLAEARYKLAQGELDHLSPQDRSRLQDLSQHSVLERIDQQDTNKHLRSFAGAAVELLLVTVASGGVGALAEGVATGARMGRTSIGMVNFVAQSASFTSLMGMRSGDLSAWAYLRDGLMFGALKSGAKSLQFLTGNLFQHGGRLGLAAKPAEFVASSVTAATVLTMFETSEALYRNDPVRYKDLPQRFANHLSMVVVLHAANAGLNVIAPHLKPGSAAEQELGRQRARLQLLSELVEAKIGKYHRAKSKPLPDKKWQEADIGERGRRFEAILDELDKLASAYDSVFNDVMVLGERVAPQLGAKARVAMRRSLAKVNRAANQQGNPGPRSPQIEVKETFAEVRQKAQDPMREQVAKGLARGAPKDRNLAGDFAPNELWIYSRDLPPEVGMQAPRPPPRNPRAILESVVGNPPNYERAYERLSKLELKDVQAMGRYRLLSEEHNGTSASVYFGQIQVNAQVKNVAIKVFDSKAQDIQEYFVREAVCTKLVGELGVGPRFYGVVRLPDGRRGLVMDAVVGDFVERQQPGPQAIKDVENAVKVLRAAGLEFGDFQYLITASDRAIIIDAGSGRVRGEKWYGTYRMEPPKKSKESDAVD